MSKSVSYERWTPKMAREILLSENHRDLRPERVYRYRKDMNRGCWNPMTGTLVFDVDNVCVDGQHRLTALAGCKEGTVVEFCVQRGCANRVDTLDKTDGGLGGTARDRFKNRGIGHPAQMAYLAKVVWALQGKSTLLKLWSLKESTFQELADVAEGSDGVCAIAPLMSKKATKIFRNTAVSCKVVAGMMAYIHDHYPEVGHLFWEPIITARCYGYGDRDVRLLLLRQLQELKTLTPMDGEYYRRSRPFLWKTVLAAWNSWADGRTPTYIRVVRHVPDRVHKPIRKIVDAGM
jgi:hypothetical protein